MLNQFLEVITIGLPFCAFKIIAGLYLNQYWLVALGVIDLIINVLNLLSLMIRKKRAFDACLFSFIVNLIKKPGVEIKHKWQDFGNSIDVLLSFTLVAYIIGGGRIRMIPPELGKIWDISVVLNYLLFFKCRC